MHTLTNTKQTHSPHVFPILVTFILSKKSPNIPILIQQKTIAMILLILNSDEFLDFAIT